MGGWGGGGEMGYGHSLCGFPVRRVYKKHSFFFGRVFIVLLVCRQNRFASKTEDKYFFFPFGLSLFVRIWGHLSKDGFCTTKNHPEGLMNFQNVQKAFFF